MNAFAWSIALNRMLFPLWSVSASSNFSVWDFSQNKAANARIFIFIPPYTPEFGSVVHGATAWRLLVTYGCCLWPLDAYVIEPPNRGCLIMLLNEANQPPCSRAFPRRLCVRAPFKNVELLEMWIQHYGKLSCKIRYLLQSSLDNFVSSFCSGFVNLLLAHDWHPTQLNSRRVEVTFKENAWILDFTSLSSFNASF